MIRDAKLKQKSLVITLLDLKNGFGEVQHSLIYTALRYHHVPDHFTFIIKSLYDGFQTSVTTKEYATPFINIGKGVSQGNCFEPSTVQFVHQFLHTVHQNKSLNN